MFLFSLHSKAALVAKVLLGVCISRRPRYASSLARKLLEGILRLRLPKIRGKEPCVWLLGGNMKEFLIKILSKESFCPDQVNKSTTSHIFNRFYQVPRLWLWLWRVSGTSSSPRKIAAGHATTGGEAERGSGKRTLLRRRGKHIFYLRPEM